jgi:hypothetical protein
MERDARQDDTKAAGRIKELMKYPWCRNPLKPVIWKLNARGEIRSYKGGDREISDR